MQFADGGFDDGEIAKDLSATGRFVAAPTQFAYRSFASFALIRPELCKSIGRKCVYRDVD
jgi:hypothetical protein